MAKTLVLFLMLAVNAAQAQHKAQADFNLIWTSMTPEKVYIRNSPESNGGVEFLKRRDSVSIAVPSPADGTVKSLKQYGGHWSMILTDKNGKNYYFRFKSIEVKAGEKVKAGQALGHRPGIFQAPIAIEDKDGGKINPYPNFPDVPRLPEDASQPWER